MTRACIAHSDEDLKRLRGRSAFIGRKPPAEIAVSIMAEALALGPQPCQG
jgi:xanthine/CO dehydrogenase XdhC/CoxF family maturation factor